MLAGAIVASSGAPFDFYISALGDDNNVGSLASPWSPSAINSKQATYSGLRLGFIGTAGTMQFGIVGGVSTSLYSLIQGGSTVPALQIQGGTVAGNTYFGSCGADGLELPRAALLDFSHPITGAQPTTDSVAAMGQQPSGTTTRFGYTTVYGVKLRGFAWAALQFYGPTSVPNVIIEKCEIYDGLAPTTASNPGSVWIKNGVSSSPVQINDNYFHDLKVTAASGISPPWGLYSIITFTTKGIVIYRNKGERCLGAYGKDDYQTCVMSYCYWDTGDFGSANQQWLLPAIRGFIPDTGETTSMHHCIVIGQIVAFGGDSLVVNGSYKLNKMTFYQTQNAEAALYAALATGSSGSEFLDNLVYSTGTVSSDNTLCFRATGSAAPNASRIVIDRNAYMSAAKFQPVEGTTADLNLTSFKAWNSQGQDANSISLAGTPFVSTPASGNVSTFAVTGPAATLSGTGGPVGAVDGSGTVGPSW